MNERKVGEIELFRFIFCMIIVCRHAEYLIGDATIFLGGAFGVEFFFLVSGYLMMASIEKLPEQTDICLANETIGFIRKKVSAFYIEYVLSFCLAFCMQCFAKRLSLKAVLNLISTSFFELVLIAWTGIGNLSVNSVSWYIQAMLLCMIILYPLIRKYPEMMKKIAMPLIAILLLGWLRENYVHLRNPFRWVGWLYKGNIRAMAELCLGAAAFSIVAELRKLNLRKSCRMLLAVFKWCCWITLILYMWYVKSNFKWDFFALAIMCFAVTLAFSKQCMDERLYQNKICDFLGKYSLVLYLNHIYFARYLGYLLPENFGDMQKFGIYLVCSFLTAFIVMNVAKQIRRSKPFVQKTWKKLFLIEEAK